MRLTVKGFGGLEDYETYSVLRRKIQILFLCSLKKVSESSLGHERAAISEFVGLLSAL